MENLLELTEWSRLNKEFTNGLASYVQSNCQVTLTDNGYRIYRPPNVNPTNNGNTMWGGFVLREAVELVKNHTYILYFDITGKSSNIAEAYWNNNCGWGGASYGLGTNPTNVEYNNIPVNFNGTHHFHYKFTVSDDVYKTCTKSYSSFVEGETYNTYRDFKFGFWYTDTGSMGTDIYITNLRMYDITGLTNNIINLSKEGILKANQFISGNEYDKVSMFSNSNDITANEFIEF